MSVFTCQCDARGGSELFREIVEQVVRINRPILVVVPPDFVGGMDACRIALRLPAHPQIPERDLVLA